MTQSGSNSKALSKHFLPSPKLKPTHQLRPKSNQRCVSAEFVDTVRVCFPRLKRSISSAVCYGDINKAVPTANMPIHFRWTAHNWDSSCSSTFLVDRARRFDRVGFIIFDDELDLLASSCSLHTLAPPTSALNSSIRRSQAGMVLTRPRQKSWLLRRSKSSTEMPCCSTHV